MGITEEKELNINPFESIGKKRMQIAAGNDEKVNTMTAS